MLRIYFASKLKHAEKWRALCESSASFQAHARWLKHTKLGTPDTAENARMFWLQDEQDVRDADAVIVYAEEGEHLRGALVEAGIAIAFDIPVFVVGEHADYGTWQYHPRVQKCGNVETAIYLTTCKIEPRYTKMRRM